MKDLIVPTINFLIFSGVIFLFVVPKIKLGLLKKIQNLRFQLAAHEKTTLELKTQLETLKRQLSSFEDRKEMEIEAALQGAREHSEKVLQEYKQASQRMDEEFKNTIHVKTQEAFAGLKNMMLNMAISEVELLASNQLDRQKKNELVSHEIERLLEVKGLK